MPRFAPLPASEIAGDLCRLIATESCVVVSAPPGAGKSTLLPLSVLGYDVSHEAPLPLPRTSTPHYAARKVLMLEPRRLAARHVAERMAHLLGERVGETVGYCVRFESHTSPSTRLEVLTEGVLTRRMADDPFLDGVDVVLFDEFHERSLQADVALCMVREAQASLRPDLKVVVMSATIDSDMLCAALKAPLLSCQGRMFDVEMRRGDDIATPSDAPAAVARTVRQALATLDGDVLAFLPGEGEIERCADMLRNGVGSVDILPLYSRLPFDEQQRAIAPSAAGRRKVVIATNIAETSLTIEGVRVVVDSGLCRVPVFNPQNALTRLETRYESLDMARQRAGRAGRTAPGVCYQLFSLATQQRMQPSRRPEIIDADLADTLLLLKLWDAAPLQHLQWLSPPPKAHIEQAISLLAAMGALDENGRLTKHGRQLAAMPCHPRLAQMLLYARSCDGNVLPPLAADVAALLEMPDAADYATADFSLRLQRLLHDREVNNRRSFVQRVNMAASQYRRLLHIAADHTTRHADPYAVGMLLATAYPDRIAKGNGAGLFTLANGQQARLAATDQLATMPWLAVASLLGGNGTATILLAAPVDADDVRQHATTRCNISWDAKQHQLIARHESRVGLLLIDSRPIDLRHNADALRQARNVVAEAVRRHAATLLNISDAVRQLQRRIALAAAWHPELQLPAVDDDSLLSLADQWLEAFAPSATTAAELRSVDLCQVILSLLDYQQQQALQQVVPTHIAVPTGSQIRIDYRQGAEQPIVRVRLQECFGLTETPRIDRGSRPLLMELLSPGFKPVQLTQDLANFWNTTYFEVRKELRRRYPKHSWPDDPLHADPVRGTRRKN